MHTCSLEASSSLFTVHGRALLAFVPTHFPAGRGFPSNSKKAGRHAKWYRLATHYKQSLCSTGQNAARFRHSRKTAHLASGQQVNMTTTWLNIWPIHLTVGKGGIVKRLNIVHENRKKWKKWNPFVVHTTMTETLRGELVRFRFATRSDLRVCATW